MKQLLFALATLLSIAMHAQVPQGIPYQAVLRDSQGNPSNNQPVEVKFSLHNTTADGVVVYEETHATATNAIGLFSLTFGAGVATVGNFTSINWSSGYKFLQVQTDLGNGFIDNGTQQLMAVPYALYAGSAGSTQGNPGNSSYFPSSDSVLTLIGKLLVGPGTYTIPFGEVWEIEAINRDGNSIATMVGDFQYCEPGPVGSTITKCFYIYPNLSLLLFRLNGLEFSGAASFNGGNGTLDYHFITGSNYDCSICPLNRQLEVSVNLSYDSNSFIRLPIYANEGQELFVQGGLKLSVSKYK